MQGVDVLAVPPVKGDIFHHVTSAYALGPNVVGSFKKTLLIHRTLSSHPDIVQLLLIPGTDLFISVDGAGRVADHGLHIVALPDGQTGACPASNTEPLSQMNAYSPPGASKRYQRLVIGLVSGRFA